VFGRISKQFVKILMSPIHLDEKEKRFEPADKPVRCYEMTLFLITLLSMSVVKMLSLVSDWPGRYIIVLVPATVLLVISLINSLFPPRFSVNRSTFIFICLVCYDTYHML